MPASRLTIRAALFDYVLLALLNVYSCGLSLLKPPTRATERSTKQPTDRPTDRSSDRPINRAIDRAIDGVIERSTERPIDRATERSTERPIERPSYQPRDQAIDPATDSYRRLPSDGLVGYRLDSKPLCSKHRERIICGTHDHEDPHLRQQQMEHEQYHEQIPWRSKHKPHSLGLWIHDLAQRLKKPATR